MSKDFIPLTQGPAVLADEEALNKDRTGYTHPNLHRRIRTDRSKGEGEYLPREYNLSVRGVNSYRGTEMFMHNEEATDTEVP